MKCSPHLDGSGLLRKSVRTSRIETGKSRFSIRDVRIPVRKWQSYDSQSLPAMSWMKSRAFVTMVVAASEPRSCSLLTANSVASTA